MGMDRRKFISVAGAAAVGFVSGGSANLLVGRAEASGGQKRPPGAKRWAMVIDMAKCEATACGNECIKACHVTHNVPNIDDPNDEIKWIWREPFEHAFHDLEHEHLSKELAHSNPLLLCNHCDNPPCVNVCPTEATWKRESDGIVMMDWHRCIGCRYCIAGCPYGSRSFNWRDPRPHIENIHDEFPTRERGVVEKCTFCEERLAKGNLPACVEACKEKGILFGDLEDPNSEIRDVLKDRFAIRRKPELGTQPEVYYLV